MKNRNDSSLRVTVVLMGCLALMTAGCTAQEGTEPSVSIIGGADAPKHIFVTSSVNWWMVAVLLLLIAAVSIGLSVYFKRKK